MKVANDIRELIGQTPLLKVSSLSRLTGCEIFLKCENLNPGGSVKDRAALQMISDAVEEGALKPGMTIVEGSPGNTGIGLSMVGRSLGFDTVVCAPKGQTLEKLRMVELFGGTLNLLEPKPFTDPGHFYHTARRMAEENPKKYWWANQFENLSNQKAHYLTTGPEIWQQTNGKIDYLVSVAGSGGTIAGTSQFLKEQNSKVHVRLVDPAGSGIKSYLETGEFKSEGSSITEGIGIMRLVANFEKAKVDDAVTFNDQPLVTLSRYVKKHDAIPMGLSASLNLLGAYATALKAPKGSCIVTFLCDQGERSYSKLYNSAFLKEKGLDPDKEDLEGLLQEKYL